MKKKYLLLPFFLWPFFFLPLSYAWDQMVDLGNTYLIFILTGQGGSVSEKFWNARHLESTQTQFRQHLIL